jgi:Ser/Thr protein kinase RdoA (MazF antagonist)
MNIQELLQPWKLGEIATFDAIQENVFRVTCTNGNQVVLKDLGPRTEEKIRRLRFERDVLHHVEQQGLSVAVPLLTPEGNSYNIATDCIYRLSHWLPNRPAELRTGSERDRMYQSYGRAIARFHLALASYRDDDVSNRTWQTDLHKRVFDEAIPRILAHMSQDGLSSFKALLKEVEPDMISAYTNLPVQLIIWDCHPGNIAVDGYEVSGFIDCDHIQISTRVFDLADILVHLVKFDIGDEAKERNWLTHFRQVIHGYASVSQLSSHEQNALYYVMLSIPLIFMDFFYYANLPDSTKIELRLFDWLVRSRREIMARLDSRTSM